MKLDKYRNKHAFLSEATSPHTLNLLLNLINKEILKKSDIVLILYGNISSHKSIIDKIKLYDIEVLDWNLIKDAEIKFLSLNPFSLTSYNASIINEFIKQNMISTTNINFLMQDDEIDRWHKIYGKYGKLVQDESASVNADVLEILNIVDNYIVPYKPWGLLLESILGRKLNIIDAVIPFSVIDYESEKIFAKFLETRKAKQTKKNTYKILFYTKPTTRNEVLSSLNALIKLIAKYKILPKNKKITIGVWVSPSYKIDFIQKLIKVIASKKSSENIRIEFLKSMTHEQYLLMLHEYDCLLLQGRGGFSTAKYYAENIGKVITLSNSFNDQALKLDYGIDTFNYKNVTEALFAAILDSNKDETEALNNFSQLMVKKHNSSFIVLRDFWKKL